MLNKIVSDTRSLGATSKNNAEFVQIELINQLSELKEPWTDRGYRQLNYISLLEIVNRAIQEGHIYKAAGLCYFAEMKHEDKLSIAIRAMEVDAYLACMNMHGFKLESNEDRAKVIEKLPTKLASELAYELWKYGPGIVEEWVRIAIARKAIEHDKCLGGAYVAKNFRHFIISP